LSREDRSEQARRVAHVAAVLAESGVIPIVALVSPYAKDREHAREIHAARSVGFLEVWVDTPLEVCSARDPKGLYAATASSANGVGGRASDGSGLTGVSSPYEAPTSADLVVRGYDTSPRLAAMRIVETVVAQVRETRVFAIH
jgi:bifunctional enzyme CysN/CysC